MALHDVIVTRNREEFFHELADAIRGASGGSEQTRPLTLEEAMPHAEQVWAKLKAIGSDEFPCMTRHLGIQFVFQWDEYPPLLTVMIWVDKMWQDVRRIAVPKGV